MAGSEPLLPLPAAPGALYVHVPFCRSKCRYCDFFSIGGGGRQGAVVEETLRQLEFLTRGASAPFRTVYVGGGTPSVLDRGDLARLLGGIPASGCLEWTVEANPESLDEGFLDVASRAGVTRLSVGIQTLHDPSMRLLGRPGSRRETLRALRLLETGWRGAWNCDLIAGIPGQSPEELTDDVREVLSRGPGHVSLYSLTLEEGTELERMIRTGLVRPNSPERDEDLWFLGKEILEGAGYERYEVSNFSLPGRRSLHNMGYWRLDPYLGVGPGAVSTLPGPDGRVLRVTQTEDLPLFLEGRGSRWGMEVEEIKPKDFLMETLLMGLRLRDGIRRERFTARFGLSFEEALPGLLPEWVDRGLAAEDPVSIRLTERGGLALNVLLDRIHGILEGTRPPLRLRWPDPPAMPAGGR